MSFLYLLGRRLNVLTSAVDEIKDLGVIIAGHSGKVVYINEWAKKALSTSSRKAKGRNVSELIKEKIEPGCDFRAALGAVTEKSFRIRCLEVNHGQAVFLSDETWHDYCERIASWAPVAQEMAHGIKTPLTTILLAAQKISAIMASFPGRQTALKYSRSIEEEAQRLQRVTDGFMRIVQIEAPAKTAVDLPSYLCTIVEEKRSSLEKAVAINLDAPISLSSVQIDPHQARTALGNVIDNAITAVSGGGRIEISARRIERFGPDGAEEVVEITVIDNGCGIKETYLKQLFTPFATFRPGGTGLGLVLAKKIIQDHGGTIGVESKENHGTTVTITLPAGRVS